MKRLTRVLLWALCAGLVAVPGISQVITGVGGGPAGGAVGGTGTAGTLAKFSAAQTLANSIASESGTVLTVANTVNAVTGFQVNGAALNISNLAGLGANCATWLATPSSANLAACMTDETGSGLLVFATAPTFLTNITAPLGILNANSGVLPAVIDTEVIHAGAADGAITRFTLEAFGNVANITGRRADGTNASKTAVQSGETLLILSGRGYGATGYSSGSRVNFQLQASENWTDAAQGTQILMQTTPNGSTTPATVLTVGPNALAILTGDPPNFRLVDTDAAAGTRNWALTTSSAAFGDLVILQSATQGGAPNTVRLRLNNTNGMFLATVTFATLGTPAAGTMAGYCSDCDTPAAGIMATCTSAGAKTGAWAFRTNTTPAWGCIGI